MSNSAFNPATVTAGEGVVVTKDEDIIVSAATNVLNFKGVGVTATNPSAGAVDVTIPGGGGLPDMTANSRLLGSGAAGVGLPPSELLLGTNLSMSGSTLNATGAGAVGSIYNILDYGGKADCVTLFDISMPNGNVVTSAAYTFVSADIGKWAIIRGATDSVLGRSPLIAKITAVSGNTCTLDRSTNTALTNITASSFPRMDFGHDNLYPLILTILAVPGPGRRNYYDSVPFAGSGVMNPILPGDGGTVFIPKGRYLMLPGYPTYEFTTVCWCEQNCITFQGEGIGATVLLTTSALNSPIQMGGWVDSHGMFQFVTLRDFTVFDLNYKSGIGNTVNMKRINHLKLERLEVVNGKGNGCINCQGLATGGQPVTTGLTITDCWVHGNTSDGDSSAFPYGIQGDGINAGELLNVHIENNRIEGPSRHGYEGGGLCYDQYIIGNYIDMKNAGMSGINPTGANRTIVIGNLVKNCIAATGANIDFSCDTGDRFTINDNVVMGNYLYGNPASMIRFQDTSGDNDFTNSHCNNFTIVGNITDGSVGANTTCRFLVLGGGSSPYAFPNAIVSGNMFKGNAGDFIRLVGAFGSSHQPGRRFIITNNIYDAPNGGFLIEAGAWPCEFVMAENNITTYGAVTTNRYGGSMLTGFTGTIAPVTLLTFSQGMSGARVGIHHVMIVNGSGWPAQVISWGTVTAANTVTLYCYNPHPTNSYTLVNGKFYVVRLPTP